EEERSLGLLPVPADPQLEPVDLVVHARRVEVQLRRGEVDVPDGVPPARRRGGVGIRRHVGPEEPADRLRPFLREEVLELVSLEVKRVHQFTGIATRGVTASNTAPPAPNESFTIDHWKA